MTPDEKYAKAKELKAEAKRLEKEAYDEEQAVLASKPIENRLIYAAYARCPCGAGLAYDPAQTQGFHGFWDCSDIMLRRAVANVKHTDQLPFAFYEIKSEQQPSANGATTRERIKK